MQQESEARRDKEEEEEEDAKPSGQPSRLMGGKSSVACVLFPPNQAQSPDIYAGELTTATEEEMLLFQSQWTQKCWDTFEQKSEEEG